MAATVHGDRRGDELVGGTPFDLGAAQTGKPRTRVPEILLGTFLVALFALAGAWFYSTSTESTSYLALRGDVQRGHVMGVVDLVPFDINTDNSIQAIPTADSATIVGKLAATDLQAGTLITPGQFVDRAAIADGEGVVGVSLELGEYPTLGLRPGNWVRVVAVPAIPDDNVAAQVVAEQVRIVEVVETGGTGRFVSLTMDAEIADVVATVEAGDRIVLIQVPDVETDAADQPAEQTSEEPAQDEAQGTPAAEDGTAEGEQGAEDG